MPQQQVLASMPASIGPDNANSHSTSDIICNAAAELPQPAPRICLCRNSGFCKEIDTGDLACECPEDFHYSHERNSGESWASSNIDVTLCNAESMDMVEGWRVVDNVTVSDHNLIVFDFAAGRLVDGNGEGKRRRYNMSKANWEKLRGELILPSPAAQGDNVNLMAKQLTWALQDAMRKSIPVVKGDTKVGEEEKLGEVQEELQRGPWGVPFKIASGKLRPPAMIATLSKDDGSTTTSWEESAVLLMETLLPDDDVTEDTEDNRRLRERMENDEIYDLWEPVSIGARTFRLPLLPFNRTVRVLRSISEQELFSNVFSTGTIVLSNMKIPARAAPAPPPVTQSNGVQQNSNLFDWDDWTKDPFFEPSLARSSSQTNNQQLGGPKKKPPPRPPPPKLNHAHRNHRKQGSSRPSDLLTGLFSRRQNNSRTASSSRPASWIDANGHREPPTAFATSSLIDLHSPSSSPTPTTRSSSDGLSVNSFGSDGSNSNNGHTTMSGNSSQFESGFEDDFDFFGNSNGTNIRPVLKSDPWSTAPAVDPFSPPIQATNQQKPEGKNTANSIFFVFNEDVNLQAKTKPNIPAVIMASAPTIIRAKPPRPLSGPTVKGVTTSNKQFIDDTLDSWPPITSGSNCFTTPNFPSFQSPESSGFDEEDEWSPPMPSIPPPPPPKEVFLIEKEVPPHLPPRPLHLQDEDLKRPHGVALYDYPATHSDDLSFQAGDIVFLMRQVNADWMYGRIDSREGMFPTNFVAEGAAISVLNRVNGDWLYGEYNGKKGQFPASFVDHVPANLPLHKL
uniref:SH3 domain-containing protein n=1 Tax=Timema tahoe TaxID=61484 RepID=A0A7R9IPC8_9NEOP|nr:unnamed protein product [Timema tahoe]